MWLQKSELRCWAMVVECNNKKVIDKINNLDDVDEVIEICGSYDIAMLINGKSPEKIYQGLKMIGNISEVMSVTSYLSVRQCTKNLQQPNVCILIDTASQDIEYVWETLCQMDEAQKIDIVLGAFDIVMTANVPRDQLGPFLDGIRGITGVIRVIPMPKL